MYSATPDIWALALLGAVLAVSAVTDVRRGRIYNVVTLPAVAAGLIGHTIVGGIGGEADRMGLLDSLAGLAMGFLPMLLIWLAGGIGAGDAKLMAAVGALTGWQFALATMFYGFIVGAVMAVIVMARKRMVRRTVGRVWRLLLVLLMRTRPGDPATSDSPKVAFGLALCIGAAAALVEYAVFGRLTLGL